MWWDLYVIDRTINSSFVVNLELICVYILCIMCACLFQDVVNGYQCNCAVGWTGTNCDVNINDCTPTSCLNGGFCYVSCVNANIRY